MVHHGTVSVATGMDQGNPGTFLKGLRNGNHVLIRANCCPAKGQPLQESFGVFFCLKHWPTTPVRVTRGGVARVPTVGIRVEIGKCASKIARIPVRLSANVPRPYWVMFEGARDKV